MQKNFIKSIEKESSWNIPASELDILFQHFPNGIIALDLETTGLSPLVDKIIEIAAIKITPETSEIFESLIHPEIPIPAHTTDIHNITDAMVASAPKLNKVLPSFLNFIADIPIVAHNAKFDLGFIVQGMQKENLPLSNSKIYCSVKLSRTTHPEMENHKLGTLVEKHDIPLLNHHHAIDDAYASLRVFLQGLKIIKHEYLDKTAMLFNMNEFHLNLMDPLPKHLKDLEQLVQDAAVVEIKYKGGSIKDEFRPVKLTSLLNTPDGNFLYARCLISDIYKSFKIKKISDLRRPSALQIKQWLTKK
jgi:DNA polymerase III epsilon subunit family exonuclease